MSIKTLTTHDLLQIGFANRSLDALSITIQRLSVAVVSDYPINSVYQDILNPDIQDFITQCSQIQASISDIRRYLATMRELTE